ncbi:MAG: DMT family transporter [Geminicoccaceae bacterium]
MRREFQGIAAALLSSCLGGISVVATRHTVVELDPLTLALLRYGIGGLCLGALFLWLRLPVVERRHRVRIALLGALFFAGFPVLFNLALAWTTAARGALSLTTLPLLTLLLAAAMGAEPLTVRKLAGVLLAIAGITLALGGDLAKAPAGAWRGDLVMLAAAACGALYNVASRPLLRVYPPVAFITQAMLAGALVLALLVLIAGQPARVTGLVAADWAAVGYLGVIGTALAFWLWTFALEHTTPTRVAVTVAMNPVVAMGLGFVWLDEAPTLVLAIGTGAVLGGILLTAWPTPQERRRSSLEAVDRTSASLRQKTLAQTEQGSPWEISRPTARPD